GDRDAALALDLHPVRARPPRLAPRLDRAGHLDGAAEEEELLGERGLPRVRVGDDGEGAPLGDGVVVSVVHGRPVRGGEGSRFRGGICALPEGLYPEGDAWPDRCPSPPAPLPARPPAPPGEGSGARRRKPRCGAGWGPGG